MVRAGVVAVVMAVLAGSAHAQAPGEAAAQLQPAPGDAPAQLQPAPPPSSVMDRRWSIVTGIGWSGFTAETEAKEEVVFGIIELGGRYRITPAMEVALALVGGGAEGGELSTGGLYADFRYRFRAERRWNPYVFGGLGVASVAAKDASEAQKAGRGSLRLAAGIERRSSRVGFFGEVRITAIAENKRAESLMLTTPTFVFERRAISGGGLLFGLNIYL